MLLTALAMFVSSVRSAALPLPGGVTTTGLSVHQSVCTFVLPATPQANKIAYPLGLARILPANAARATWLATATPALVRATVTVGVVPVRLLVAVIRVCG
jgi:hypothetical protein